MRVLLIKTSSMGDVIHTLPAICEAAEKIENISFDWVVEQAFADIPKFHAAVANVIPVRIRQWRKHPFAKATREEFATFKAAINQDYDLILDAQGLLKSAWLTRLARGPIAGLSWSSAREPLASLFYQRKIEVYKQLHAIERLRLLFAKALNYDYEQSQAVVPKFSFASPKRDGKPYVILLHGTTWKTKHWSNEHWQELAKEIIALGFDVLLPWGNESEKMQAQHIAAVDQAIVVLPKVSIKELASYLNFARAVVAVDTGLGHLTAALGTPSVSIYGPTNSALTGTLGLGQAHLISDFKCAPCLQEKCALDATAQIAPCMQSLTPNQVLELLKPSLEMCA